MSITFKELKCWKACRELRLFVATQVIPALPQSERAGVGDQMLRAAHSMTASLAEEHGRFQHMDNAMLYNNTLPFCREILDHLTTVYGQGLISKELMEQGKKYASQAINIINGNGDA